MYLFTVYSTYYKNNKYLTDLSMDIGNTHIPIPQMKLPSHPPKLFVVLSTPTPKSPPSSLEGKGAAVELLGGPEPSLLGRRAAQQEELV